MKKDWEMIHFNFVPYKDTGISVLSAIDDVQVLLEDHIVKTTTMKNSPFIKPFDAEVTAWDQLLVIYCYLFTTHCTRNLSSIFSRNSEAFASEFYSSPLG